MKKNIILLIAVIFTTIIFTGCGGNKTQTLNFSDNANYLKSFTSNILTIEQLTKIVFTEDTLNFRLIDIRSPQQYKNGHLSNAINIPLRKLLNENFKEVFNQDKVVNVLYGNDDSQAFLAGTMINHYNLKNNWIALGGYDYIQNNMLNNFGIKSLSYNDETPEFDYAKIVAETSGAGASSTSSVGAPPPQPKAGNKKKKAGGGCE
ncbi:MAG: hypothetical protein A2033_11555 [Bacteroidetes bacterium GWA2_31_9]|nr:MAG: hypothetical protein A2033_11555 [Bacteroidetes bacterium GWA2_31_9]